MIREGHVHGLIKPVITSVGRFSNQGGRLAVADGARRAGDNLAGDRPVPVFAFVAESQAAHMQVRVGQNRIKILVRPESALKK